MMVVEVSMLEDAKLWAIRKKQNAVTSSRVEAIGTNLPKVV